MRKLARSRKGSTMVLATLLIVVVTIVAGILFYNTIMGSVTSMTNNVNTQMALLIIEGSGINATHNRLHPQHWSIHCGGFERLREQSSCAACTDH